MTCLRQCFGGRSGNIYYGINQDTNEVLGKEGVLQILWQNPYLIIGDTIFKKFNDSMSHSSMGQILAIDTSINELHNKNIKYVSLLTALENITPSSAIETNIQSAIDGYLQFRIQDSLSKNQVITLRFVANQCPDWGGNGVFMSRALLSLFESAGTVYSDTCKDEKIGKEVKAPKPMDTVKIFKVFPNPNRGDFYVMYYLNKGQTGMLIIYNLLGEKIRSYILNPSVKTKNINASRLPGGAYIYKIVVNGNPVKQGKLIILR